MAATSAVHVFSGVSPGTGADVTSTEVRYKRADNSVVNALNPIPIPTSSVNYSWQKSFKLYISTAPANQITNLRWFTSGTSLGTGITHYATTDSVYTQGSTADESALISGGTDSSTYTSGSPLTITSGLVCDSTDSFPLYEGTSGTQDFLITQIGVGTSASAGTSGVRTATFRYNES